MRLCLHSSCPDLLGPQSANITLYYDKQEENPGVAGV